MLATGQAPWTSLRTEPASSSSWGLRCVRVPGADPTQPGQFWEPTAHCIHLLARCFFFDSGSARNVAPLPRLRVSGFSLSWEVMVIRWKELGLKLEESGFESQRCCHLLVGPFSLFEPQFFSSAKW